MEIRWNRLEQADWQGAMARAGAGALQQSWRYGAALAAMGRRIERAEICQDGCRLGLAQLLCRDLPGPVQLAWLARGPVWLRPPPPDLARRAMRALATSLGGAALTLPIVTPETPQPGVLPLMTGQSLAELPLSKDTDAMRAALHGKWRNRLVRAEQSGLRVSRDIPSPAGLQWLLDREGEQRQTRGYAGLPDAFLDAWRQADLEAGLRLYTARLRGRSVAAMLFLDHAPGVTYHIGWSSRRGRNVSAHNLLLWRAARDFGAAGRLRLDLGTLDTVTAPGLARFKLGTGASVRRLGGAGLCWPGLSLGPAGRGALADGAAR